MSRAVVIGGGLSGLTSALLLARLGHEVTVLEKNQRLLPLIRGFSRSGLHYETGFHYAGGLDEGGVLRRYLDRLGLLRRGLVPTPVEERLRFADGDLLIPRSYAEFRSILPGGPEVDEFFKQSLDFFQKSPFLNPQAAAPAQRPSYNEGPSLAARLEALPLNRRWKAALGFRCLLYGVRPSEAAFGHFSLVNVPYLNGGYGLSGGSPALTAALEAELRSSGVKLLCGLEARSIVTDAANTVKAVAAAGDGESPEELEADLCVYSASPTALPGLLPPGALRPVLSRRLSALKETPPPFLLFGHSSSPRLAGSQLFICPEADLEQWFDPKMNMVYVSGGQVPGPESGRWPITAISLLPEGATSAWKFSGSGKARPAAYLEFKEKYAADLKARLLKACPELNGDLEVSASATDLSLEAYSFNFGGGIYGKLHSINEAPVLPLSRVGGLALAGQSIILPGLLGAVVSSALAVSCLSGPGPVLEVLR